MQPRILVIGEAMQDLYHIGEATRLSPEAPVPVVKIQETLLMPGGAANVVANLEALGASVSAIYAYRQPQKNRLMVGNTQLARWDTSDSCEPLVLPMAISGGIFDALVISDYGKGAFLDRTNIYRQLLDFQGPVFIDTKQNPLAFCGLRQATFFPNRKEYDAYTAEYNRTDYVLKDGAEGMRYQGNWEPARAAHVVSVSGAGDTVIAAFAYAKLRWPKQSPASWLAFASYAAAVVVSKPYTATASVREILQRGWRDDN